MTNEEQAFKGLLAMLAKSQEANNQKLQDAQKALRQRDDLTAYNKIVADTLALAAEVTGTSKPMTSHAEAERRLGELGVR